PGRRARRRGYAPARHELVDLGREPGALPVPRSAGLGGRARARARLERGALRPPLARGAPGSRAPRPRGGRAARRPRAAPPALARDRQPVPVERAPAGAGDPRRSLAARADGPGPRVRAPPAPRPLDGLARARGAGLPLLEPALLVGAPAAAGRSRAGLRHL